MAQSLFKPDVNYKNIISMPEIAVKSTPVILAKWACS